MMDRRQPFGHAGGGGSRGLRIDGGDLVAGLDQTGKRGHREVGRAHEDEPQGSMPRCA